LDTSTTLSPRVTSTRNTRLISFRDGGSARLQHNYCADSVRTLPVLSSVEALRVLFHADEPTRFGPLACTGTVPASRERGIECVARSCRADHAAVAG
jgi:hypothetical protein